MKKLQDDLLSWFASSAQTKYCQLYIFHWCYSIKRPVIIQSQEVLETVDSVIERWYAFFIDVFSRHAPFESS